MFKFIYEAEKPVTKQDISVGLGLSLPTVSQNLSELLEEKKIEYCGTNLSTGGRKPRAIRVVGDAKIAVGISLTAEKISFAAIDLNINEVAYDSVKLHFTEDERFYKKVAELLEKFIDDNRLDRKSMLGVGITVPGIIFQGEDLVKFAPTLSSYKIKVGALKALIPYPSVIQNDANASGFAEWWSNSGKGNMVYLFLERGVGGSILMRGEGYLGDNGRSGEFGHMCIVPDGRRCSCGQLGCFEAYCSTSVITDVFGLTLEEFFARVGNKEGKYVAAWEEYLRNLSRGISNIRAILDCEIVVGGVLSPYMEPYLDQLRDMVSELNFYENSGSFVRLCRYKTKSTSVGVALYFISDYINNI